MQPLEVEKVENEGEEAANASHPLPLVPLGICALFLLLVVGIIAIATRGGDDPAGAAPSPAPSPPWWDSCESIPIPSPTTGNAPFPAPPADKGYFGVPQNGIMIYNGLGNVDEIQDFLPECMSGFCDKNIGTKMPDKCCDPDAWKKAGKGNLPKSWFGPGGNNPTGEDDRFQGGNEATCYVRDAPCPFCGGENGVGGKNMQKIRNYLGCEDGQLYGHENCVPGGLQYITKDQYKEGAGTVKCDTEGGCPWSYPMSATVGEDHHVNGTGDQCHCSKQSYFTQGAGCYLAFATLAQYVGMFPAVFVKIGGTCDNSTDAQMEEYAV